ncbi:unnamed protein product [Penicillium glandicola]
MSEISNPTNKYGLTAVPASAQALLTYTPSYPVPTFPPTPIPVSATPIPDTPPAQRINTYARTHLPEETYNHSRRVYHFGLAIKRHRFPFADWDFDDETFLLACLLYDIGTTEANITATRLSFDFFGGVLALRVLQNDTHDNIGAHPNLVHAGTIKDVSTYFPRKRWSHCFAATIRRENGLKPWAYTTALGEDEFTANVLGNMLMAPYECLCLLEVLSRCDQSTCVVLFSCS